MKKNINRIVNSIILILKYISVFSFIMLLMSDRKKKVKVRFLGKKIHATDNFSFLKSAVEIFVDKSYQFSRSNDVSLIIDCGSNIGLSVIFFKTTFPNAKVIGFEADKNIYEMLSNNVKAFQFSDVQLENKAVWNKDGSISFVQDSAESGHIDPEGKFDAGSVESIRLKSFLEKFDSIDFLKMDIEGAEFEVIKDCKDEIKRCDKIFIEYHSFEESPQHLDELMKIIKEAGFRYYIKEASSNSNPYIETCLISGMDLQLNIFAWKS